MNIKSLEKMENLVSKNRFLSWDGWNVVELYPSEKGLTSVHGAYQNGKWNLKKVFSLSETGWDIPDKYVR